MWLVALHVHALPRNRHVGVYLDVSHLTTLRNNHVVAVFSAGATLGGVGGLSYEEAVAQADAFQLALLESSSLKSVLARCMRNVEPEGEWVGSPGEFAARQFGLGTWEWVQALQAYRQIQESRKAA